VIVCRHGVPNKRATNKNGVRKRATNKSGSGRKRAKAGDQSIKVAWVSDAVEVGNFANLSGKLRGAVGSLTSRADAREAWCELIF
jgi:hypothetical protein